MDQKNNNFYSNHVNDSVDLIRILKQIWNGRKIIFRLTFFSFIIGCIFALLSPVVYVSETTFVPQTSDYGSSSNIGIGSLASLAGINLNTRSASSLDNYLSPLLYDRIIKSDEFSMKLIDEELIFINGNRISLKSYLQNDSNSFNLMGIISMFSVDIFKKDKENENIPKSVQKDYNFISAEDYAFIKSVKSKYSIEINKKDGYIKVIGNDKDPFISTQIVKLVTRNLQSRIISLRTKKIKEQLDYSRIQYDLKKKEFETLQNNLAEFKDSNKNISTAVFKSELEKIQSEYQLQQTILSSLASEYNRNKIKLNKDTPIFSVLDEVSVPNQRSKPKRKLIVLVYLLFGIVVSIVYILINEPIKEFIQRIKVDQ